MPASLPLLLPPGAPRSKDKKKYEYEYSLLGPFSKTNNTPTLLILSSACACVPLSFLILNRPDCFDL